MSTENPSKTSHRASAGLLSRRAALGAGLAAAALPGTARAAWPERPLRWIVAYAPGGGSDTLARLVGQAMAARLGQPVVVENRPGAATNIGAEAAAKAPADGYTVFTADNGTLIFNPALFRRLPYDPERDFRPLGLFARYHLALAVKKDSQIRTAQDYIARAKANPRGLDYGTPGIGSPHHLGMERAAKLLGMRLNHIPYRGGAPGLNDLIAGNLESMLIDLATAGEAIRAGQVRALAVASAERYPGLPELPTIRELGAEGYAAYAWQALVTQAAVPDPVAERLSAELLAAMGQAPVRERIQAIGVEPLNGSPREALALMAEERRIWVPLIRDLGISLDT